MLKKLTGLKYLFQEDNFELTVQNNCFATAVLGLRFCLYSNEEKFIESLKTTVPQRKYKFKERFKNSKLSNIKL